MGSDPVDTLAKWWHEAEHVAVATGAGMSAESGIPTFRDPDSGLWARFDPAKLASPEGFAADPERVWGWYLARMAAVRRAEPNAGHRALATLADGSADLSIITQNVDDLHERAGSRGVVHLHGSLLETRCYACARPIGDIEIPDAAADAPQQRVTPPRCGHCGGYARPGVVWFGESLPVREYETACNIARNCDLLIAIGTSGEVAPASALPGMAQDHGARFAEINPAETWLTSQADLVWRATAAEAVPQLILRLAYFG